MATNGFQALRHVGGGAQRYIELPMKSAYDTNIFSGDAVEITTDAGYVNAATATGAAQKIGVFSGCMYTLPTGEQKFSPMWPANTIASDIRALVSGDNGVSYRVQADTVTDASVGSACDLVATAGSTITGLSGMTVAVGAGAFSIRKILDDANNIVEVVATNSIV